MRTKADACTRVAGVVYRTAVSGTDHMVVTGHRIVHAYNGLKEDIVMSIGRLCFPRGIRSATQEQDIIKKM